MTRNYDLILDARDGLGGSSISLALARKSFRLCLIEQAPDA